jgi:tripartite-type tricarboxylate transporter receptor subunit TctC
MQSPRCCRALTSTPGLHLRPGQPPADVTQRPNKVFVEVVSSPDIKDRLSKLMAEPASSAPERFAEFAKSELSKCERLVKASGAKVD